MLFTASRTRTESSVIPAGASPTCCADTVVALRCDTGLSRPAEAGATALACAGRDSNPQCLRRLVYSQVAFQFAYPRKVPELDGLRASFTGVGEMRGLHAPVPSGERLLPDTMAVGSLRKHEPVADRDTSTICGGLRHAYGMRPRHAYGIRSASRLRRHHRVTLTDPRTSLKRRMYWHTPAARGVSDGAGPISLAGGTSMGSRLHPLGLRFVQGLTVHCLDLRVKYQNGFFPVGVEGLEPPTTSL